MATTQQPSSGNEPDDVLDLEPTAHFGTLPASAVPSDEGLDVEFGRPQSAGRPVANHGAVALVAAGAESITGGISDLRRARLAAVSALLAAAYLLVLLFYAGHVGFVSSTSLLLMALRVLVPGIAAALLYSQRPLEPGQVRGIEYFVFGFLGLMVIATQYFVSTHLLQDDRVPTAVAFLKNGVLQTFALMVLYGTFLPNDLKAAAQVILSLALAPILGQVLVEENHPELGGVIAQVRSAEPLGSNLIYLVIGAGAGIYSAHVLGGLRAELREARRFGQYKLVRKLGEGGMGEVYLAEHQLLKRPCALKLIRSEAAGDAVALARFEREVKSAAQLAHPNTIGIFDYGQTEDGTFYYVMEYLVGLSLADLITHFGPITPGRLVYLLRQVCAGLSEAHDLGLVHRDLKPANIFVAIRGGEYDVVKVLDFGLVKVADPGAVALTADQTVSGTPLFMSPEQATGVRDVDGRSDIYALGAIAYFALTGQPPFVGESAFNVMMAHARDPVTPPSKIDPSIPKDLEAVIMRCLAKQSSDRFPTVRALGEALAACIAAGEWGQHRAETWWKTTAEVLITEGAEEEAPALASE